MTTVRIDNHSMFVTGVTVRESDKYSEKALLKFHRYYVLEAVRDVSEMYLSVDELENLGRHLLEQAKVIRAEQIARKRSNQE